MKNVLGSDGVINIDGKLGSGAEILQIDDPCFYNAIEDGIKSTVKTLIDNGFETYSSCQGHHDSRFSLRNVVIVLNESEINAWRAMIAELNIVKRFTIPITYEIAQYKKKKKGLMVIFGSIFDIQETEYKQKCFERYIPHMRKYYYCKNNLSVIDYTAKCGHVNIFKG